MRKGQKYIDPSLGPIGILQEGLNIFRTHAKVSGLIHLTFMLGLVIVKVIFFNMFPDPANFQHRLAHRLGKSFGLSFHDDSPVMNAITLWLLTIVYGTVLLAALSLSLSATLYSVGLHYAGQAVSFLDVIRASIPHLWMRLAVTTAYYWLTVHSIALVQTLGFVLLSQNQVSPIWTWLCSTALIGLLLVGGFALSVIFTVALCVSVLEEDYGWAAMVKGLKLLKGRLVVAIPFQLLLWVPGSIVVCFVSVRRDDFSALRVPTGVFEILSANLFWQLTMLWSGVQYASFKAYHNESITDSLHQKRAKEGYEYIAIHGSNEALLGGQEVGNKV